MKIKYSVLDYFDTGNSEEERLCKECHAAVMNESSHMFHHLMKRHPVLYKEAKMQARPASANQLCKLEDEGQFEGVKEEKPKLFTYSPQPKEAIIQFMGDQLDSVLPYDARLYCSEGSVQIHRLVLASMSPMLAILMQENTEEEESIYIDGSTLAVLQALKHFLYNGGSPSDLCESILETLNIRPDGISAHFSKQEQKPERRSSYCVKEEPQDLSHSFEESIYEPITGISISRLKHRKQDDRSFHHRVIDYFTEVENELYQCSICENGDLELIPEENLSDHLSIHPEEWDKLQFVKKRQRSKVWNYFERETENSALCRHCGASVKIYMGSTTQMIQHLKKRHEDLYSGFDLQRDNSYLEADVLETAEDIDQEEDQKPFKLKPRKKKKLRSKIWFYYRFVQEGVSQCKECDKKIIINKQSRGSTSGLIHHLRHAHPHLYSVFQAIKESRCASKEEFTQIAAGVKIEDAVIDVKPKKIKLDKKKKKGSKRSKIWAFFTSVGEGQAQCTTCNQVVNMEQGSTSNMIHHLRRHHSDLYSEFEEMAEAKPEMVMCEFCSETYDNRKMLQHNFNNHFDSWYPGVKNRFNLIKDKLSEKQNCGPSHKLLLSFFSPQGEDDASVSCRLCQNIDQSLTTILKDSSLLEHHLSFVHPEVELVPSMSLSRWLLCSWAPDGGSCHVCGTQFESEVGFSEHMMETHKVEQMELADWEEVLDNPGDPLSFKTALLIEKYEKTGGYWENGTKLQHKDLGKMDDPVFRTCGECKKIFSTSSAMRYHHRVVHSGDKPFKCDFCEKAYNRKDTLDSHMASHSDLKPFMCQVCGKQFGRRHIRDTHERRHRGEKKHGCTYCNKRFMSSQQLKNHTRVHTGEKPFSCEHCGRMFAVKHQLVTHLRIHTGERPYGCSKCDQKFKHLSTRRNHKCVGDIKPPLPSLDPLSLDQREQLYRIPIPPGYQAGI